MKIKSTPIRVLKKCDLSMQDLTVVYCSLIRSVLEYDLHLCPEMHAIAKITNIATVQKNIERVSIDCDKIAPPNPLFPLLSSRVEIRDTKGAFLWDDPKKDHLSKITWITVHQRNR